MNKRKTIAILYAILAAIFYALNIPFSKIMLNVVSPTILASLLYLGAGIGIGIIFGLKRQEINSDQYLSKSDFPYVLAMIILDTVAPILLMFGLLYTASSTASLLNNFEIVATSVIALVVFKELISKRLWVAIFLITIASIILSMNDISDLHFSYGSILIIFATLCWGFENNCTRKIALKNTYQIVMIKGIFSGLSSFFIAMLLNEKIPKIKYCLIILFVGFVAYGLSILFYIMAQRELGAAKTSAFYAVAPFIGVFLSIIFLKESISINYLIAFIIMLIGSIIVVIDTLIISHNHNHTHVYTHTHNGITHTHSIVHCHDHYHLNSKNEHYHIHELLHNK